MAHRRITWSGGGRALIATATLTKIKAKVDAIAADLATLEGLTEAQREGRPELDAVIQAFDRIAELA